MKAAPPQPVWCHACESWHAPSRGWWLASTFMDGDGAYQIILASVDLDTTAGRVDAASNAAVDKALYACGAGAALRLAERQIAYVIASRESDRNIAREISQLTISKENAHPCPEA